MFKRSEVLCWVLSQVYLSIVLLAWPLVSFVHSYIRHTRITIVRKAWATRAPSRQRCMRFKFNVYATSARVFVQVSICLCVGHLKSVDSVVLVWLCAASGWKTFAHWEPKRKGRGTKREGMEKYVRAHGSVLKARSQAEGVFTRRIFVYWSTLVPSRGRGRNKINICISTFVNHKPLFCPFFFLKNF